MNDDPEDMNFWPAFTDSMLAVVLVLLVVLGAVYLATGERIKQAQDCEAEFANGIPNARKDPGGRVWKVLDGNSGPALITFEQDFHDSLLLHVTFSDSVLGFEQCDDRLGESGRHYLTQVGSQIKRQLESIVEIQIQGHADITPIEKHCPFADNLHLASARADAVFLFLQQLGISPVQHAMSAVSYGEYFPANRRTGDIYTQGQWVTANASESLMQKNRRVELILRYGTNMKGCAAQK